MRNVSGYIVVALIACDFGTFCLPNIVARKWCSCQLWLWLVKALAICLGFPESSASFFRPHLLYSFFPSFKHRASISIPYHLR